MNVAAQASAASESPWFDLLVIGCGLRATGLLTATPELFGYSVGIVDGGDRLGVGSFDGYDIQSNSNGSDFFGWIDPAGPFGPVLSRPTVRRLREIPTGFHLRLLADALVTAGDAIQRALEPRSLLLGDRVTQVGLADAADHEVRVVTGAGRVLRAGTVVLATGIREISLPGLDRFDTPVIRSSELLDRASLARCAELAGSPGTVCFVGASHSAFSVLARMLRVAPERRRGDVAMLTRSPVKIYYEGWAEYHAAAPHAPEEAVPDPHADVCPETGNLHRYSGLRNTSKELFHAVAAGRIPGVRLVREPDGHARDAFLRGADTVVQAAGYGSNVPTMSISGEPVTCLGDERVVRISDQGRLRTGAGVAESVFVMGMDPYPYDDNTVNPTSQYGRRGRQLLDHLARRKASDAQARSTTIAR